MFEGLVCMARFLFGGGGEGVFGVNKRGNGKKKLCFGYISSIWECQTIDFITRMSFGINVVVRNSKIAVFWSGPRLKRQGR